MLELFHIIDQGIRNGRLVLMGNIQYLYWLRAGDWTRITLGLTLVICNLWISDT